MSYIHFSVVFSRRNSTSSELNQSSSVVSSVVSALIEREDWDGAFAVATRSGERDLLVRLVNAAWEELLAEGRVATLLSWLDRADELHARSPMFDLVEAEVAWREGAYDRAERLALAAANSLGPKHLLSSRAYFRAGLSAHFEEKEEVAFEHQRLARSTAATDHDLANALWGGFVSGLELERPDTGEILEELASLSSPAPSEAVRVAAGRLFLACRQGTGLNQADFAASSIVERVDDPLVRLSFGHAHGGALVFSGRYEEAIETIDRQIAELERYGLAFALPHSYLLKAAALQGSADSAKRCGHSTRWMSCLLKSSTSMHLSRRFAHSSVSRVATWSEPEKCWVLRLTNTRCPSMRGEYFAARALVLACSGDNQEAARKCTTSCRRLDSDRAACTDYVRTRASWPLRNVTGSGRSRACGVRPRPQLLELQQPSPCVPRTPRRSPTSWHETRLSSRPRYGYGSRG